MILSFILSLIHASYGCQTQTFHEYKHSIYCRNKNVWDVWVKKYYSYSLLILDNIILETVALESVWFD